MTPTDTPLRDSELNARVKPITVRQVRKQFVSVQGRRNNWRVYLRIDQQSFCIDTAREEMGKRHAQWYARMLSIALARLVNKSKGVEFPVSGKGKGT